MSKKITVEHFVSYPNAISQLQAKHGATPEELAAWVFYGPTDGGISAYMNANELDQPPLFSYAHCIGSLDYMSPLMACWFKQLDLEQFHPIDRYITGDALIERWGKQPGLDAKGFIRAKIVESRLSDLHPITGGTGATFPEMENGPPLESGLFLLSEVEEVELNDFGQSSDSKHTDQHPIGSPARRKQIAKNAADALHDQPGGSRDRQRQMREIWASGKFKTKHACADQEHEALGMSFDAARKALTGIPKPSRC